VSHPCAGKSTLKWQPWREEPLRNAAFEDAAKVLELAKSAPPGPQKDALWRKAGKMYEDALRAAPEHKDAPAAAINSAYAYKQVDEFRKAIDVYRLFIDNYGRDELLEELERGDPKKKRAPDPRAYEERIEYLGTAYDALATTYYGFFAYRRAAEAYGEIATNSRFDDERRASAARIAMVLHSKLGDRANATRMHDVYVRARVATGQRVEGEYLKASFDYDAWSTSGDDSAKEAARRQAIAALSAFHRANAGKPESARYGLEAAYRIAKLMQAGGDSRHRDWFKSAVADWDYFNAHPATTLSGGKPTAITATDAPYADYGGEAAFTLLDEQVRGQFDYATGHHRYSGTVPDVLRAVDADLGEVEKGWRPRLERIATRYGSNEWAAAANARIGSLYDSLRTGLDPYVAPQQKATGTPLPGTWQATKDRFLDVYAQKMVASYVTAAFLARKYDFANQAVDAAIARLAYYADCFGDDMLMTYVENTPDPFEPSRKLKYIPGQFLQWRSGVLGRPQPSGLPAPSPVP
jgi:hypothetical protein